MYLIKFQHRILWLRQFAGPQLSHTKRIVKFSVIAMSFVDRCCSYSLNNSSKSVKNKLHWLFISFWSACVTSRSLPSAILLSDKFSSPQTLSVETGQLGPNLLTRILSRWSWQVLGSWKLDMSKCLSSRKETFFELIFALILRLIAMLKLRRENCWTKNKVVEVDR